MSKINPQCYIFTGQDYCSVRFADSWWVVNILLTMFNLNDLMGQISERQVSFLIHGEAPEIQILQEDKLYKSKLTGDFVPRHGTKSLRFTSGVKPTLI